MCDNVAAICSHLQQQQHSAPQTLLHVIPPLHSSSSSFTLGPHFVVDAAGSHWRCTRYVEGSVTLHVISSPSLASSVAAAFGHFSSCMRTFTATLADTIPSFHHTPRRLAAWQHALHACALSHRLVESQLYVAFVRQRATRAGELVDAMASGRIPTTASHNDAKIGNVLLRAGAATSFVHCFIATIFTRETDDLSFMCIIDLDTTMQGTPLCVRTSLPHCYFVTV